MDAEIVSLAEARKRSEPHLFHNNDFQSLFTRAGDLRHLAHEEIAGDIALVRRDSLTPWFQRELAEEVFQRKLFARSILTSIWFVADLLTTFGKRGTDAVAVAENLRGYGDSQNPLRLLDAANAAFLMFVFWPDHRVRRSLHYREYSLGYGPGLYARYGDVTEKEVGFQMAEAFEPLGVIARERFSTWR